VNGSSQPWQPVSVTERDAVDAGAVAALHGLLDAPGPAPAPGRPLPPLWHWLGFLPRVPQSELGDDGHPARGGFLPPVRLSRRMFAGGRLRFAGSVLVGEPLARTGVVESVTDKTGRSGPLVFVTVRYEVTAAAGSGSITEHQDLVFRDQPGPGAISAVTVSGPAGGVEPADRGHGTDDPRWSWGFDLATDPRLLFRFSALTYNAHRIHYDREWATSVEHYPGLVVHGPLQAIALAELCRRNLGSRPLAEFRFRSLAPAFDGGYLRLRGRLIDPDRAVLVAFDGAGRRTMEAEASMEAEAAMEAEATGVGAP